MSAPAPQPTDPNKPGSLWNINSWHWEEKDWGKWAKERLPELFKEAEIPVPNGYLKIIGATIEGEAYVNVRKGKKIVGFELKANLEWEGEIKDGEGKTVVKTTGKAKIPNLDEDQDEDEYELSEVTVSGESAGHDRLRSILKKEGLKVLQKKITQFRSELVQK